MRRSEAGGTPLRRPRLPVRLLQLRCAAPHCPLLPAAIACAGRRLGTGQRPSCKNLSTTATPGYMMRTVSCRTSLARPSLCVSCTLLSLSPPVNTNIALPLLLPTPPSPLPARRVLPRPVPAIHGSPPMRSAWPSTLVKFIGVSTRLMRFAFGRVKNTFCLSTRGVDLIATHRISCEHTIFALVRVRPPSLPLLVSLPQPNLRSLHACVLWPPRSPVLHVCMCARTAAGGRAGGVIERAPSQCSAPDR